MKSDNGIVRVGSKPRKDYINASLFCLDNFSKAKIRGLGNRQGDVLEIAEALERIEGIGITSMNEITADGVSGLEVIVERVKGGESGQNQE